MKSQRHRSAEPRRKMARVCLYCRAEITIRYKRICEHCRIERRHIVADCRALFQMAKHRGDIDSAPVNLKCIDCGKRAAHWEHRDYREPLKVVPVCATCNHERGPGAFLATHDHLINKRSRQTVSRWGKRVIHRTPDQQAFCKLVLKTQ